MLNDAMKALTTRKPIALTTTSLCSGAFTARIARTQRLHALRIAGAASPAIDRIERRINTGLFRSYALDLDVAIVPDAAAAIAALAGGTADVALTDIRTAVGAHAHDPALRLIAVTAGFDEAYVALAPAIDAHGYAMSRFARALRENAFGTYVDARELQARIDALAAERTIDAAFPAADLIGRVAVMSGTR